MLSSSLLLLSSDGQNCWSVLKRCWRNNRIKTVQNLGQCIDSYKEKKSMFPLTLSNDNRTWSRQRRRRDLGAKMNKAHLEKLGIFFFIFFFYSWLYFLVLFVLKGCSFKASAPCKRLPADLGVKTRNMSRASRSRAAGSTAAVLLRFIRPIRWQCDPARCVPTLPCQSVSFLFVKKPCEDVRKGGLLECGGRGGT